MAKPGVDVRPNKLRWAREARRLSVRQAAELVQDHGVALHYASLSNIENGTRRPGPRVLTALCAVLDIDPDDVIL